MASATPSSALPMGAIKYGDVAKSDPPRVSDQAQRFVLVAYLLQRVGMCSPDMTECLARYVHTLPAHKFQQLKVHFPRCDKLFTKPFRVTGSLEGLAALGDAAVLTAAALGDLLRAALVHFAEKPEWAYGANGFLLWTASKAAAIPVKGAPQSGGPTTGFWLGEVENAVWVAAMSRAVVLRHGSAQPIPALTRRALREGFYTLFNLFLDVPHFDKVCKCADKGFAYHDAAYPADTYELDVLPMDWPTKAVVVPGAATDKDSSPAELAASEKLAREKAFNAVKVQLARNCAETIWTELDRRATAAAARADEAAARRARARKEAPPPPTVPADHAFNIQSLFVGKQRAFCSGVVNAHWKIAAPLLKNMDGEATAFAVKLHRGDLPMTFTPDRAVPAKKGGAKGKK